MVYKARSHSDGSMMALKKVAMAKMEAKEQEKCLKEVRLLESLTHPSIIRYFEAFIEEEELIIVCEWASGGDLRRVIKKANEQDPPVMFSEPEIWRMFHQIVAGVKYMHEQRIMHRDIKPANVLIMGDGKLKLADLGLGRFFSDQTMQAYSKVGTPVYMSPEVLHGKGYDLKSDVWSLGCLLYELATLRTPFKSQGDNLYVIFKKINECQFERLPEGQFSPELCKVVNSILKTDASARPHTNDIYEMAQHMTQKAKQSAAPAAASESTVPKAEPNCVLDSARVIEWMKLLSTMHEGPACPAHQLCRFYFALESASKQPGQQFETLCACVDWLLSMGGLTVPNQITGVSADDAAIAIISALQANQISNEPYTLPRVKQGWGVQVVDLLLRLVEAVAVRTGWKFQMPVREAEKDADELPEDENLEGLLLEANTSVREESDEEVGEPLTADRAPMESGIDPVQWKLEMKRVSAKLKVGANQSGRPTWSSLVQELAGLQGSARGTATLIKQSMTSRVDEAGESLAAIEKQENVLQGSLQSPVSAYHAAVQQHSSIKERYDELTVVVESCAASLAEVGERLDGAKDSLSEHSGNMDDTSSVVRMKQGLTQLKRDCKDMELQIGMARCRLGVLQAQQQRTTTNPQGFISQGFCHD